MKTNFLITISILLMVLQKNFLFAQAASPPEPGFYVSLNGSPSALCLTHGPKVNDVGISFLPELEFALDTKALVKSANRATSSATGKICLSVYWSGGTTLITSSNLSSTSSSTSSNSEIQSAPVSQTNIGFALGYEFSLSDEATSSSSINVPAISGVAVQFGYGNFNMSDGQFHQGFIFTLGFKIKAVQFKIHP